MPEDVGTVYVRVRPDTSGFAEEAKSEVGSAVRGARSAAEVPVRATVNRAQTESTLKRDLGGAVKSTIGYIGGIFAAEKVFEFGKEVINEAATVQKMTQSIEQEYGEAGDALERFAHGAAANLGISAAASETASARFGALFANLGLSREKSAQMTLGLQKVVGSLAQIKDVDPGPVLDRLNTTLATGSTRGLRSLGIALDSTSIKAEAMRLGLVKTTKDTGQIMAAQDKAAKAQENLTQVQAKYGKGSEQFHQATIANVLAHESLAKAVGGTAQPLTVAQKDQAVYSLVTKHLGEYMQQAKEHSGDYANQQKVLTAEWANAKATIGEKLLPVATGFLHVLLDSVKVIVRYKTEFIGVAVAIGAAVATYAAIEAAQKAYNIAVGIGTIVMRLFGASTEAAGLSMEAFASLGIGVVVIALYELYQHSETARRIMNEIARVAKEVAGKALEWVGKVAIPVVTRAFQHLVSWTQAEWKRWGSDIMAVARAVWKFQADQLRAFLTVMHDVVNIVNDLIHGRWGKAWNDAKMLVKDAIHGAVTLLGDIVGDARRIFGKIGPAILSVAGRVVKAAVQLGEDLVRGIVHGITSAPGKVAGAVKDAVGGALSDVGGAFGIGSPSRVFAQRVGKPISDGIVLGTKPLHDDLRTQMVQQMNRLQDDVGPVWHDQFQKNVGQPVAAGTVAGVRPLGGSLGATLIKAAHDALARARSALGIGSPSMVYSKMLGEPLAQGVLHGMGGLEHALQQKIVSAATAATSFAGGIGSTPTGTAATGANQRLGYQMMLARGWPASQWGALQALWMKESGWNQYARNPSSGAFGIPQELGHAVSSAYLAGDVAAQIAWGLDYIRGRYGSPGAAWAHSQATNWYQGGGVVTGSIGQPQAAVVHGGEVVFTPEQAAMLGRRGITIHQLIVQTPSAEALVSELDHIARSL